VRGMATGAIVFGRIVDMQTVKLLSLFVMTFETDIVSFRHQQ